MNSDVMESVLHEVLNEQKETSTSTRQLLSKIEYLSGKLENLAEEINMHQPTFSSADTESVQIIAKGIENIKQIVAALQKNVMYEKRIIIFPEFKSPECYRLLFNCITYITIATYGFLIIKVVVDNWCR
jgi:hypothetical protein